ncbi:FkbM family methyltransferase [Aminobacter ciceronei]|uniref:FkbM family methyltransferase n=1 Tax=Aminobacter ciceronei TaxID=150723 RepID=A0ABR6C6D2_9HYPH|nr:FkbM family methyltransferase [Aminobacter ciceronei]MBA8906793.1 FkbM family methyltransferase [Aminobacter ciceronei]MBA9020572.1 FkbM family methyltransferase [Aminobacter ciceronei]
MRLSNLIRSAFPPAFIRGQGDRKSSSQLQQDLWALSEAGNKTDGFFVEVGAYDGVTHSNTYLLEQVGWAGILAEPNPAAEQSIVTRRKAPLCSQPVGKVSGVEVDMLFVPDHPELSTMQQFAGGDRHASRRADHTKVTQTTISLNDLLARYDAPKKIDFISIDTEGSEPEILEGFDFGRYDVRLFAIEHNYTQAEKQIDRLMKLRGYERVHRLWSRWDAWYRKR